MRRTSLPRDGDPVRTRLDRQVSRPLGPVPLTEGQAVTVLVAVGLDLIQRHRAGLRIGRLQPGDVLVDAEGRPGLAPLPPNHAVPGEADRDAWLRLAWSLAPPSSPLRAAVAAWSRETDPPLAGLVPELLEVAVPQPLAVAGPASSRPVAVSGRRRARHAARRRWRGRGTRTRPR